jgi:hypothetical protein
MISCGPKANQVDAAKCDLSKFEGAMSEPITCSFGAEETGSDPRPLFMPLKQRTAESEAPGRG